MATLEIDPMMIEILSRLPPESLLRFKSVCKSWYALINDPKFVTQHCLNSHYNQLLVKRNVMKNSGGKKEIMLSVFESVPSVDGSVCNFVDLDLPFDETCRNFEIHGHCHGLVCLSDARANIILCNPTTREFRYLPPSILLFNEPPPFDDDEDTPEPEAVGFGYDAKSRDFKVVRIVDFVFGDVQRVEIYDLSKDRWREIDQPTFPTVEDIPLSQLYHEGTHYWLCSEGTVGGEDHIQSFDMSKEVFGLISLPERRFVGNLTMGILNGSIVLFHCLTNVDQNAFEVWKMESTTSSGVGVGWSKLFRIDPVFCVLKLPLFFVTSHELLIEAHQGQIILYNIKTQRFKDLPVKGDPRLHHFHPIFLDKTLISVKGGTKYHL